MLAHQSPACEATLFQQNQYIPRSEFRQGIEQHIAKGDLIAIGKQQFKEVIASMHTGKVRECVEAWMAPDVTYRSEGLPYNLNCSGREGFMETYNRIITEYYGCPDAQMVFRLNNIERTGVSSLDIDITITTSGKRNLVERMRSTVTFDKHIMISESFVTPILGESSQMMCINPAVVVKAVVRAPSFVRPCLHNFWDSVRTKKGVALLRCRTCVSQWKIPASDIVKCKRFLNDQGCSLGVMCPHLHINARKKNYEDRMNGLFN
eukprot:TRINITY_DN181_c0_g1_i11.p3 TRINITY_DN181_c0_g1~~TRINITY_DN181_c0_g1_i11.p3  ORF type:complete len:263 (+),score=38.61 TRINITY_DN181_c0_g1_i11:1587-2375(+)